MGTRQVSCGTIDFYDIWWQDNVNVVIEVTKGGCPANPEDMATLIFTSGLWEIVEWCWMAITDARPALEGVLACLGEVASSWSDGQN